MSYDQKQSVVLPSKYNAELKEWSAPPLADMEVELSKPFGEYLLDELQLHGEKLIQINHDTGSRMTCNEMRMKSLKVAEHLSGVGIQRGDHVTIIADHSEDLAPVFLGALAMGLVVNPLHCGFSVAEFQYFFELIKPSVVICDEKVIESVCEAQNNIKQLVPIYAFEDNNDIVRTVAELLCEYDTHPSEFELPKYDGDLADIPALILCSSGTTGLPKGVLVSHTMAMCGLSRWWPIDDGFITFNTSSLYWLTAIVGLANSIRFRSPRIITAQTLTIDIILDILEKYGVDTVFLAPPHIAMIIKRLESRPTDLSKLCSIQTGGSPLSSTVCEAIKIKIPSAQVATVYGMTDVGGGIACSQSCNTINSVGWLVFGIRAKVINEDGQRVGPGEFGEICLKKPCHLLGYLNNKEATRNAMDNEDWFLTGDIGYFNEKAELFLIDRKKDMIKYRGFQIAPSELEEFIQKNFDILAVIVVGIPDDEVIFLPAAVIVAKLGSNVPSEVEICEAIKTNYSDAKQLRGGVYFVQTLPRTSSGKVQRNLVQNIAIELYNEKRKDD